MKTIKLLRTQRYCYGDQLFLHGNTYTVKDEVADVLLVDEDSHGLPYFVETSSNTQKLEREQEIKKAARKVVRRKPVEDMGILETEDGIEV
jgi:hypothetical protein